MSTRIGLERVARGECDSFLQGTRIGLLAHPASVVVVDGTLFHAADVFGTQRCWTLCALFGPQHGWFAETQDNMIEWKSTSLGAIPLYSLYGEHREPTAHMLKDIDLIVVDLQDVGCRVYTFVQTLFLVMRAAAEHHKGVIVLDRPNPIGCVVEGPNLDLAFASFVGLTNIPLRHGKTIGELAKVYAKILSFSHLDVVEMQRHNFSSYFDQTGLLWVNPSPNMPNVDTAVVYPGMVLFEGTNVSEGRGLTRPFEHVGAPGVNMEGLLKDIRHAHLPGVLFRSVVFIPTFHKFVDEQCSGVQLHITDRSAFRSTLTGAWLLRAFKRNYANFKWLDPPYEYEHVKMPIDILSGSPALRQLVDSEASLDEFIAWASVAIGLP